MRLPSLAWWCAGAVVWMVMTQPAPHRIETRVQPYAVSMFELLSKHQDFEGQRVCVVGYAYFEDEGDALYFHREDLEFSLLPNSVRLDIPRPLPPGLRQLSGTYVIVEGVYSRRTPGPALRGGVISEITRLERLPGHIALAPGPPPKGDR